MQTTIFKLHTYNFNLPHGNGKSSIVKQSASINKGTN